MSNADIKIGLQKYMRYFDTISQAGKKQKLWAVVAMQYDAITKQLFDCGVVGKYDSKEIADMVAFKQGTFTKIVEVEE